MQNQVVYEFDKNATEKVKEECGDCEEVQYLLAFIKNSKRGVCRGAQE